MTTLFGSILATAVIVQVQTGAIQGKVADEQGKPTADVPVHFFCAAFSRAYGAPGGGSDAN